MIRKEVRKNKTYEKMTSLKENDEEKRSINCKWDKIKQNETFRARLIAQWLTRILWVDYDDNLSPVIRNMCKKLVLAKMLGNKHQKKSIKGVETAFLYEELDKILFLQCTP